MSRTSRTTLPRSLEVMSPQGLSSYAGTLMHSPDSQTAEAAHRAYIATARGEYSRARRMLHRAGLAPAGEHEGVNA